MSTNKNQLTDPKTLVLGTGVAVTGIGVARSIREKKVNPNKILVRGGAVTHEGERVSTVFNSQREAWSKALRDAGIDVEEAVNYVVSSKGKYTPTTKIISEKVKGNPIAELHVGAHPSKNALGLLADRIVGKTQYRTFSDFGPGNQESGRKYLGTKNWMKAPKLPIYDRNIVPGGKELKTTKAIKSNIDVETIPTNKIFSEASSITPAKEKTKILLSAGTGYVWPKTLPNKEKDLEIIRKSISTTHPNAKLTILGGPHVGEYDSVFKDFAEKNKDTVEYVTKTDAKGMRDIYKSHDISIMAPGSTTAEVAAMEGYKPKILGLGLSGENHFKYNTEWFDKKHGGAEFYDLKNGYDEKTLTGSLNNLKSKAAPSKETSRFLEKDIKTIIETAKSDFKAKKIFTKNLKVGGGILLAAGGVMALKDQLVKTGKKESNDFKDTILPVSTVGLAVRTVENKVHDIKSRKVDFASMKEVKDYYKNLKPGDIIASKDKFTRGIGHPHIVVDAKNYYDWPTAEGWKNGLREVKVEKGQKITAERPHRLKGKIVEAYPGSTVFRTGSLEGKLQELSMVSENFVDTKGVSRVRNRFDRKVSRELGGIFRDPNLDPKKLESVVKIMEDNAEKGLYKYRPLSSKFKVSPGCAASGNCVTFAQGILNASRKTGKESAKVVNLPGTLYKGLQKVKPSRTPLMGKTNYLTPLLAIEGGIRVKKGIETDDPKKVLIGAGEVGAGLAINMSKSVNSAVNNVGGLLSQTLGGLPIEGGAGLIDKLKNSKSTKTLESARNFLKRNPGVGKTTGTAILTVPLVYGLKKGVDYLESVVDKNI